jgi:hypothetical protein
MAINGRINVDVLFHDTDGTASLKVVSLEDSTEYTTGQVAIVTGTCGTSLFSVYSSNTVTPEYRDASGSVISFTTIQRAAFIAAPAARILEVGPARIFAHSNGRLCVVDAQSTPAVISVQTTAGTASYTLVIYGT